MAITGEFLRVYDNFKCRYKKVWKLIECTKYFSYGFLDILESFEPLQKTPMPEAISYNNILSMQKENKGLNGKYKKKLRAII